MYSRLFSHEKFSVHLQCFSRWRSQEERLWISKRQKTYDHLALGPSKRKKFKWIFNLIGIVWWDNLLSLLESEYKQKNSLDLNRLTFPMHTFSIAVATRLRTIRLPPYVRLPGDCPKPLLNALLQNSGLTFLCIFEKPTADTLTALSSFGGYLILEFLLISAHMPFLKKMANRIWGLVWSNSIKVRLPTVRSVTIVQADAEISALHRCCPYLTSIHIQELGFNTLPSILHHYPKLHHLRVPKVKLEALHGFTQLGSLELSWGYWTMGEEKLASQENIERLMLALPRLHSLNLRGSPASPLQHWANQYLSTRPVSPLSCDFYAPEVFDLLGELNKDSHSLFSRLPRELLQILLEDCFKNELTPPHQWNHWIRWGNGIKSSWFQLIEHGLF